MDTEFQFYQEKVLELGYSYNNVNILDCTFKMVNMVNFMLSFTTKFRN